MDVAPDASPFVGRGEEIARLRAELDRAARGRPRIVLVEGAAGIGKTTLVECVLAGAAGAASLRAYGDEPAGALAFGVVDQLLRQAGAGSGPLGAPESEGAHIAAGTRMLRALGDMHHDGPVVVAVDDAHWADDASLRTLLFVVRRLVDDPVLLVLAARSDGLDRLPEGLVKLAGGRTGTRLLLGPLKAEEVRALAAAAGVPLSAAAARRLQAHAAGSPLHVRALLEEVAASAWERPETDLPAPRSFAALIYRRVDGLAPEAAALLDAAAVLGQRTTLAEAAQVAGVEAPFAALDAPVVARLVTLASDAGLTFTHPLVRAAILQRLSPGRRAELQLAAAERVQDPWLALQHRMAASPGADEALADELEAFAADRAAEAQWSTAVPAYAAAGRLSVAAADRERRLIDAVEAATYAGDGPRARVLADDLSGASPHPRLDCALVYVDIGRGRAEDAELRLERAWAACDRERDPVLAVQIAERMAFVALIRLRAAAVVEWGTRLDELTPHRAPLPIAGLWPLAIGLYDLGRRAEAYAVFDRVEAVTGRRMGGIEAALRLADGDLVGARALLRPVEQVNLVGVSRSFATQAQLAYLAGDWDDAEALAARAVMYATEADQPAAQTVACAAAVTVAAARGDVGVRDEHVATLRALQPAFEAQVADVAVALATAAAADGRHADVLAALAPVDRFDRDPTRTVSARFPWTHLFAWALAASDNAAATEGFLTRHEPCADPLSRARLARVRGTWEAARERPDAAAAAFMLAREALPDGMPYETALTNFTDGCHLRRAGRRRAADATLSAARDTFAVLGARPLLERCVRELDACGLRPMKRSGEVDRDRLTPQERVVARLVTRGLDNAAVASELTLSVRTVERHLTRIYRKLGVHSRAALSRALN